ncbi:polyphenol oxidase [Marchantia polymorpha subsp. ruderalis]
MRSGVPSTGFSIICDFNIAVKMGEHPMQKASRGRSSSILSVAATGRKLVWASYMCSIVLVLQYLAQPACADPVLASSVGFCKPVRLEATAEEKNRSVQCCLPAPRRAIKRFKLPHVHHLRVRRPAHELANDVEYVNKYNLAYERMNALPADDPRSFLRQWHTHCSFCKEAYLQRRLNTSTTGYPLQLHYSWTFLPWHRMLIYFHEKILGSLINDPDFTLPFWNWDNQLDATAGQIPQIFLPYQQSNRWPRQRGRHGRYGKIRNTFLYEGKRRNPNHMPPKVLPLTFDASLEKERANWTHDQIRHANLGQVYEMVYNKVSAREYLGGPYDTNSNFTEAVNVTVGESGGSESLHNTAHEWVGMLNNTAYPDNEDMGVFTYAGRDPIFYSHHANVDRLWNVWKALPDKITPDGHRVRKDYDDYDFLETEFTFYDENADMVIVKVKDTLESNKLGYTYQPMVEADSLWINHKPNGTKPSYKRSDVRVSTSNAIGRHPTSFKLRRHAPTAADLRGTQAQNVQQLSEGVVFEHVRVPELMYVRFDVFLDSPSATAETDEDESAYVGTFTHLPSGVTTVTDLGQKMVHVEDDDMYRTLNIRFSTSLALKRLGVTDWNTDVTVTVVPRFRPHGYGWNIKALTFSCLRQEFT